MSSDIAYFKFQNLPTEVKIANGFSSGKRLDCIKYCGMYAGLDCLINHEGMLYFYKNAVEHIVYADAKRKPEWCLTGRSTINGNSINVTSLYNENLDYPDLYFGYPNNSQELRNGDTNPFYPFRHDGYLFLANQDITELEMLIIPHSRNLISSYYQLLINGELDSNISQLRQQAQTFYDYWSIVSCNE